MEKLHMMTDTSGILLDTIVLYVHSTQEVVQKLAETAIEVCTDSDSDPVADLYKKILIDLMEDESDRKNITPAVVESILIRYKKHSACKADPEVMGELQRLLLPEKQISNRRLANLERHVRSRLMWAKGNIALKKVNSKNWKYGQARDATKQDVLFNEMLESARELVRAMETSTANVDETVDEVILTNKESIQRAMEKHDSQKKEGIMKFGMQGMNQVFEGGPCLGEFVGIAARSHHYKSCLMMDMLRWLAIHNKPKASPGAIPTLLFISLENEAHSNSVQWYRDAYRNAYRKEPDPSWTTEQIASYVTDVYAKNGWHIVVRRKLGELYGFREFVTEQTELKQNGMNVAATIIDYAALMKTAPSGTEEGGNDAKRLQNLHHQLANFFRHNDQLGITGVQLNQKADWLAQSGSPFRTREMNQSMIADSTGIYRELDAAIFQEIITNVEGREFLSQCLDKRRGYTVDKNLVHFYPFTDIGILDDLGTRPTHVLDPNESTIDTQKENDDSAKKDTPFS